MSGVPDQSTVYHFFAVPSTGQLLHFLYEIRHLFSLLPLMEQEAFKRGLKNRVGKVAAKRGENYLNIPFGTVISNRAPLPGLHELLETVLPDKTSFENFKVGRDFPGIWKRKMLLNARRILGEAGSTQLILLAFEDITAPGCPRVQYENPAGRGHVHRLTR